MIEESEKSVTFPVMEVDQNIGRFFIGSMKASDLVEIAWFDVRRLSKSDEFDNYLGVQRIVSPKRVAEIARYLELPDATFPTAVILSVQEDCASIESIKCDSSSQFSNLTLSNRPGPIDSNKTILFRQVARVLDGQHRIAGLKESKIALEEFYINVCVFVGPDISDQASIFATVNLAQTKVNPSLAYDLLSYSRARSPERTCHVVTVALDSNPVSPFYNRIKRLGVATEGRFGEILSQATVVKSLLPYLTKDVIEDRKIGKKAGNWDDAGSFDRNKQIFRDWFIDESDEYIAQQIMNYFEAVKRRWPDAWSTPSRGNILPRTNGFRGFMRFLRPAFIHLTDSGEGNNDGVVKMSSFLQLFETIDLSDRDFNSERFLPGTTGETAIFNTLLELSGISPYQ